MGILLYRKEMLSSRENETRKKGAHGAQTSQLSEPNRLGVGSIETYDGAHIRPHDDGALDSNWTPRRR